MEKCGEGLPDGFFVTDDNLHVDLGTGGFYLAERTFGPTTTCTDCKRTYAVEQMVATKLAEAPEASRRRALVRDLRDRRPLRARLGALFIHVGMARLHSHAR